MAIYKSLNAAFSAQTLLANSSVPAVGTPECDQKPRKEHVDTSGDGDSQGKRPVFSSTAHQRVQVKLHQSSQNDSAKSEGFGKRCMSGDADRENIELATRAQEELGAGEFDVNPAAQSSPTSPPSFGDDSKGLDEDSSDQGSQRDFEKYLARESHNEMSDNQTGKRVIDKPASGAEGIFRDLKRQKKPVYRSTEMSSKANGNSVPMGSYYGNSGVTGPQLEPNCEGPSSGMNQPTPGCLNADKHVCAFCQSSQLSEDTGAMLHYIKGKPVEGDEATNANVTHVHSRCIQWAPLVYYVGENVKNLSKEVARSAKLKCTSCGLKGAALGCYEKSCRRTYHVPCSLKLVNCRWDVENYLLLCPAHSKLKFPEEKSNFSENSSKTFPAPTQITSQQNFWPASSGAKNWILCGSALSLDEKLFLVKFGNMIGVTVSKNWNPNVTHVIAATDLAGACTRTLKVLMAILSGKWVLTTAWIKACMEAMQPVDEEPYEVNLDNHGCCEGPKTGRLRVLRGEPKLFNGLRFYFCGEFVAGYKRDLQELIIVGGGTIIKSEELLMSQGHDTSTGKNLMTLVVYNLELTSGSELGEEVSVVLRRLEEADKLAAEIGSRVIPQTWILESISACKLQPFAS